ncbi:MAG: Riboflavin biosynthesis protein RibF [Parcubacteria group bacterium GW2011_GWA2_47_8]|nr:MAG: Riboflavin biosynthesis protein RibF [Parcubacteria group bacterium GW2011_GWA2_47_8]
MNSCVGFGLPLLKAVSVAYNECMIAGIDGIVIKGSGLGATLGIPTANMRLSPASLATIKPGVYASRVHIGTQVFAGATHIGKNITVGGRELTCETHIIGYQGALYGTKISLELVAKIRDTKKFASLEELVHAMRHDISQAKAIIEAYSKHVPNPNNPHDINEKNNV